MNISREKLETAGAVWQRTVPTSYTGDSKARQHVSTQDRQSKGAGLVVSNAQLMKNENMFVQIYAR